MINYRIKNISEKNIINSEDKQDKQVELTIEAFDKIEKIQLSGNGALKVSTPV